MHRCIEKYMHMNPNVSTCLCLVIWKLYIYIYIWANMCVVYYVPRMCDLWWHMCEKNLEHAMMVFGTRTNIHISYKHIYIYKQQTRGRTVVRPNVKLLAASPVVLKRLETATGLTNVQHLIYSVQVFLFEHSKPACRKKRTKSWSSWLKNPKTKEELSTSGPVILFIILYHICR